MRVLMDLCMTRGGYMGEVEEESGRGRDGGDGTWW